MADEFSLFSQLSSLNPPGKPRDAKEVPVEHEARRRGKGKKKKEESPAPEKTETEGREEKSEGPSGKVVDIII